MRMPFPFLLLRPRAAPVALLVLLPWLLPIAAGPSPMVQPWLVAAACTCALAVLLPWGRLPWAVVALLLAWPGFALLRSGLALDTLALAAGGAVVFLCACVAARGDVRVDCAVGWGWLAAALASVAIALLQYLGLATALEPWISAAAAGEAIANLRQRNQFATLTLIGLAVLATRVGEGSRPAWMFVAAACLGVGNAASGSRTGLLGLVCVAAVVWLWPNRLRVRSRLVGAAVAAYAAAVVLLPQVLLSWRGVDASTLWGRVASGPSCSSRRVLWSNVLDLVREAPWGGWGWGRLDFAHFSTLYREPRFCDILDNAHNLPLHLAVELGLPFALVFCLAAGWLVLRAHPWREADLRRQRAWLVLGLLALHSLLEYPLWYGPFQMALGFCLGSLWGDPRGTMPPRVRAPIAAVGLAAIAFAAWDYQRVTQVYLPPDQRQAWWRDDALAHARRSVLFANQARFAELTLTALTPSNAQRLHEEAEALLAYSPEPRVIEKAIESAALLGLPDARLHRARYEAAFPAEYQAWRHRGAAP